MAAGIKTLQIPYLSSLIIGCRSKNNIYSNRSDHGMFLVPARPCPAQI